MICYSTILQKCQNIHKWSLVKVLDFSILQNFPLNLLNNLHRNSFAISIAANEAIHKTFNISPVLRCPPEDNKVNLYWSVSANCTLLNTFHLFIYITLLEVTKDNIGCVMTLFAFTRHNRHFPICSFFPSHPSCTMTSPRQKEVFDNFYLNI